MLSQKILDNIMLEGKYKYSVYTTIEPRKNDDYNIRLEFLNLTPEDYQQVAELYKLNKSLEIKSDLISRNGYNITHILTHKIASNNLLDMVWECFSDDTTMSLIIE